MTTEQALKTFINSILENKVLWGLQGEDDGWVVCDSEQFENCDVMPLWSSIDEAKKHCSEEWSQYTPEFITLADFLEFWVEDLNEDGVRIGLDWQEKQDNTEVDVFELAKALADVESTEA